MPAHFDFETRQTFYSAQGDVFAWLCAVVAGLMLVGASFEFGKDDRQGPKGKM
jgi:apolipoprotein N-acyltransferase